nr:hypothetical protein [Tanacetum cinerariifolium]
MASFNYRLNPLYPIKECSSCGALYTTDYYCSEGSLRDKIIFDLNKTPDLSQRPPQNCPKCGNRLMVIIVKDVPFYERNFRKICLHIVLKMEFSKTFKMLSSHPITIPTLLLLFKSHSLPNKTPVKIPHKVLHESTTIVVTVQITPNSKPFNNQTMEELPQTVSSFDPTCYSGDRNSFTYDSKSNIIDDSPNVFNPPSQPPLYSCEFCGKDARYGRYCTPQEEKKQIKDEQAAKARYWKIPVCYDDDDDEDCTIAITPTLSSEEPDNSLSMGDEHLDTILTTELDEFIKSSVENLVPIPSKSEGIPDNMCDVSFHDNSPPLNVSKDQFEDFSNSNDDSTSIDDESFSIENIEYVEASPPNSELISSEVMEIVIPKVGGIDDDILLTIKDDILREKLLNINLLIANIEALKDNPTPSFDFMTNSGSTTTRSDISLPDYEAFYDDHVKETSSGSTTTHFDSSLYDLFIFDLSINPFPPADGSDFYHEEFADELAHIISPQKYDCFCFKNEPNSGDFTIEVVEDIFPTREPRVHNALPTHPSFQLNLDFILSSEPLFAYVIWIFLYFLSYSAAHQYLLSFGNEDTIFDPDISSYHISSFMPDVSHRSRTFIKFNVYPKHLNGSSMENLFSTCSPMDQ